MEQETETKLPIKTKITAWWMIAIGIIIIPRLYKGGLFFWIFSGVPSSYERVVAGLLLIISGCFLLKRKKIGWWLSITALSLIILLMFFAKFGPPGGGIFIIPLILIFLVGNGIYFIPLILLLLDRKNFFKIAT